jgi:isoleucyl-tRNA synthetase
VLDQWIVARAQQLVNDATAGYTSYELDKATRPIGDFIDDLSVWYLRRSRDRFKGVRKPGGLSQEVVSNSDARKNGDNLNSSCKEDVVDRTLALATLRHVLRTLALTIAPAMPFYAEYLWLAVRENDEAESVHLAAWPTEGLVNEDLLEQMVVTRNIVTAALEARTKSGIKVRQPIAVVFGPAITDSLVPVVLDELNAKTYQVADIVAIETALTPALIAEGAVRELMRAVQGQRKQSGLEPADRINLAVATSTAGQQAIAQNQALLLKTVGADAITYSAEVTGEAVIAGDLRFTFSIT